MIELARGGLYDQVMISEKIKPISSLQVDQMNLAHVSSVD